jgi:F-type H+-transporting ATPase subunit delta
MLELVRGYATAAFDAAERAERLAGVAADLGELARLLVVSDDLRATLTDGSLEPAVRSAVLDDLFAWKIVPEALAPVTFAVLSERASDLPKTVERLVELAEEANSRAVANEPPGAEPPIGRSGAYERIRGFADRILEQLASPREVDVIEDELFRLARLAEQTPALRETVAETASPIERRLAVLADLLTGKVRAETAWLACYVLRAGRSRDFVGSLDYLVEIAAAERGRRIADVRSAVELDADERERLSAALSKIVHRPVELRVRIDPTVLGGCSIRVGNTVIDGTVRHRLDQLRESLFQRA